MRRASLPELEIFNTGDMMLAHDLIADGTLRTPALFQIVTGIKYGHAVHARDDEPHEIPCCLPDSEWAAFGAGRHSFTMLAQAYTLGGHCRIGMEDTVHLAKGSPAPSNAALVAKAVRIIEDLGAKIATVSEARELLGLKSRG